MSITCLSRKSYRTKTLPRFIGQHITLCVAFPLVLQPLTGQHSELWKTRNCPSSMYIISLSQEMPRIMHACGWQYIWEIEWDFTLNTKATCLACMWGLLLFVSFIESYSFIEWTISYWFHDYDTTNVHSYACEFQSRSLPRSNFFMIEQSHTIWTWLGGDPVHFDCCAMHP